MANPNRRTRRAAGATEADSRRFPRMMVFATDAKQDDEVREFAASVNRSISEIGRDAVAAGLPVLRRRAIEDGTLDEAVA